MEYYCIKSQIRAIKKENTRTRRIIVWVLGDVIRQLGARFGAKSTNSPHSLAIPHSPWPKETAWRYIRTENERYRAFPRFYIRFTAKPTVIMNGIRASGYISFPGIIAKNLFFFSQRILFKHSLKPTSLLEQQCVLVSLY